MQQKTALSLTAAHTLKGINIVFGGLLDIVGFTLTGYENRPFLTMLTTIKKDQENS